MAGTESVETSSVEVLVKAQAFEPLGALQLDAHARHIAQQLAVVKSTRDRSVAFRRAFDADVHVIELAYNLSAGWTNRKDACIPIAEWLLDNFYVVQEQIRDIRDNLPLAFFRELPKLSDGGARVHTVARELVSHCDNALDEELIVRFVDQFQLNAELTIGETWAFPVMLRLVLIENLSAICSQLVQEYRSLRDVEGILEAWERDGRFHLADGSGLRCAPTVIALDELLRDRVNEYADAKISLDRHLQSLGWNLVDLRKFEQHRLAANQVSIGNIITSMRLLESLDWVSFFELTNRSERILRRDPVRVYEQMDFSSRNRYRTAIEEMAKRSNATETEVALHALRFSQIVYTQAAAPKSRSAKDEKDAVNEVASHIGFWLVDDGRVQIEKLINYRPKFRRRLSIGLLRHPHATYFGGLFIVGSALFAMLTIAVTGSTSALFVAIVLLLAILPISEMAVLIMNSIVTHVVGVHLLPKLEFRDGVSEDFPTVVAVPSMLTSLQEVTSLLARLEDHFLANSEPTFLFALLTDFGDASQETLESDPAILQAAIEGIQQLNERYAATRSSPFYLFHRQRRWNASEGKWMGWERKRGKLMEFAALLAGDEQTSYTVRMGDLSRLSDFRSAAKTPFVITLDSDTILPRGSARKLVGTLAHPLNRPITRAGDDGHFVTRGYSILQPRVSIHLGDTQKSRYLKVHAANPGIDPYASAASDVYQDLFAEGSFTGKGIFDLRAFERTLSRAFPENRILSHDLIEGCHARVALVSDIEVFDGFPSRYDVDSKRQHRWVRGDWQISRWLLPRVPTADGSIPNPLSALSKWKILDNLRRSLVAPALLAFLVTSWILISAFSGLWSWLAAIAMLIPVMLQAIAGILNWSGKHEFRDQMQSYFRGLANGAEQAVYCAAFLPYKAVQMTDAVLRTMFRLLVSRKRLLEWETATATESRLGRSKWTLLKHLSICPVVAVIVLFLIDTSARIAAVPWLSLWLMAPVIGQLISLPRKQRVAPIQPADREWLERIACATWAFFEQYVNPEGHWLPPDNVQDFPKEKVAFRISPTNEGLFLVSGLVARRMGFIGLESLVGLWEKNLASWNSLEQLHGHHFNWYETSELKALHPYYVSTVDSGNLMACYLTLCDGIADAGQQPLIGAAQQAGAQASLSWLKHRIEVEQSQIDDDGVDEIQQHRGLKALHTLIADLSLKIQLDETTFSGLSGFVQSLRFAADELSVWATEQSPTTRNPVWNVDDSILLSQVRIVIERFRGIVRDVAHFLPWLQLAATLESNRDANDTALSVLQHVLVPQISLRELAQLATVLESKASPVAASHETGIKVSRINGEAAAANVSGMPSLHSSELSGLIREGSHAAAGLLERLAAVRNQCEAAAFKMDFRFLYNSRRKLFSIGYNVDVGKLDRGHYDLLCSECRIASYLAIAKGDVETEHWFRLGRQATLIDGQYTLLSWGGTMFEFLMPQLFQRSYEGSLIDTSCRTAVHRQTDYGRTRRMPWGISESAYAAMASNSDYQYKSFGVPGLGLKRGLLKDMVVSPYSSALALPLSPAAAASNLKSLAEIALGRWGFYDAVDFTPRRLRRNQTASVVRNYMAHHHGMTLLAIANATQDQIVSRWFHAHPLVRANELLLQERVPGLVNSEAPNPDEVQPTSTTREETTLVSRQITGIYAGTPRVLLLSNGQFSSLLTHTGGSYARHNDMQVTRWRSDATRDCWGSYIYLRDKDSGSVWSATYQPTRIEPDHYEVLFSVDKGEVHRRQGEIETWMELVVSPDHNAEVRQLRITNHGPAIRRIEVTSYVEVVLASQAADLAHPAFQKLFVETEYIAEDATLIARRRARDSRQNPKFALHTLALPSAYGGSVDFESSREKFLGRGRTPESPLAMSCERLTQTTGAVLDAVFSLRCMVSIAPAESVTLGITTAVADTREQALALADLFHDLRGVQRAFELAWAFTQIELRHLNISAREVHLFQQLGGQLLYPEASLRGDVTRIAANELGQKALWRFGISGDVPILLLRIGDTDEIEFARTIIAAFHFLLSRGLTIDLVISNDYPGSYFDALQDLLQAIVNERLAGDAASKRLFLLRGAQLTCEDHQLLEAAAAVVLRGNRGSLAQQLGAATMKNRTTSVPGLPRVFQPAAGQRNPPRRKTAQPWIQKSSADQEFPNGFGSFIDQGRCYEILVSPQNTTPAPWSNVIANPDFGCLLSESGGGYTWFGNSRENKLTVWSNDPTSDTPSEIVYLRDIDLDVHWSPVSSLDEDAARRVVHGQGFTIFSVDGNGIQSETLMTVHAASPLKIVRIRLHNTTETTRRLQVTYYAETVMGVSREETALHQVSSFDAERTALMMSNGYHPDFKRQCMFLTVLNADDISWTADRRSFIGRDGSPNDPVAMKRRLNQRVGAALDPCLVMQGTMIIEPGGTEEVVFLVGAGKDRSSAMELLDQHRQPNAVSSAISHAIEQWNSHLTAFTVQTPNRALDVMLNRWLPYQVLSCRVWGRSAFYQSGGAYGFRDQLQDVMALVYSRPDLAREQILTAAARQFPEGDVQHWWHPPGGKGTRTRFSDDFLFLPFVVLHYLQITGDRQILSENAGFIKSPRLNENEQERFEQPVVSEQSAPLLDHCLRAMQHGLRYGQHGLPLMGCGDWNDGMNRIGEAGQGESVWVAWFQIVIFERFAKVLREINDDHNADRYDQHARTLREALERTAWDGEWYRRAFFDDATPLGSQTNDECQIDSLTQSWAVIAGGPTARSRQAFESAVKRLVDHDSEIVLLFEPPFDQTTLDPGYVKGYLPGVRENGGQYTHAAVWMIQAATMLGDGELAMQLFDLLNPIHHSDTREEADRYKVEPYVIAADVYSNSQHLGRGGWTWYTGAAGWMYRVAIEHMLGIRIEKSRLMISPSLPASWSEFRFSYRRNATTWHVHAIRNSSEVSKICSVNLIEDGQEHHIELGFG